MSVDLGAAIDSLAFLIVFIVYLFVTYRGAEMTRAFVNQVYRSRARWIVALGVAILINDVAGHAPYVSNVTIGGVPLGLLTIFLALVVAFAFGDRTILVTLEMDFFHRDTLHWRRFRYFAYPLFYGDLASITLLVFLAFLPSPPSWVSVVINSPEFLAVFFGLLVFNLAYVVGALFVGARRTPDRIIRRHLIILVLFFGIGTLSIINDFTLSITPLDDFLALAGAYVWYRATMTLSPIGRVEKEGAEASALVPQSGAPT